MIALLDTSFVRHLERAGELRLIGAFRAGAGWEFVVPEGVLAELARRRVPPELEAFLADGTARAGRCDRGRETLPADLFEDMGMGEAEAVCIVDGCEDRTFKRYVILTGDRGAQAAAGALGMSSLDVVEFLLMANKKGMITAGGAAAALGSLEASGYCLRDDSRDRYMRGLV